MFFGSSINAQRVDQKINDKNLSCRNGKEYRMIDDETYDVKHYHLDLEISLDTEYIEGSVIHAKRSHRVLSKNNNSYAQKLLF